MVYSDSPFLWRDDLDNSRLHAILVDFGDECLEAAKLAHSLGWKSLVS